MKRRIISMKTFLTYTAIIEAITGLGLMIIPSTVVRILLDSELVGSIATLLAMVGGTAIFSLALGTWLNRMDLHAQITVRMLMFYNAFVGLILFFGKVKMEVGGIILWSVIIFHFIQAGICLKMVWDRKRI